MLFVDVCFISLLRTPQEESKKTLLAVKHLPVTTSYNSYPFEISHRDVIGEVWAVQND